MALLSAGSSATGYFFEADGHPSLTLKIRTALDAWQKLQKNEPINLTSVKTLYAYMTGNGVRVARGKKRILADEDELFTFSRLKNEFGCVQEPLASYRIHDSNISRKKIGLFIKELENWVSKNKNLKKMKNYSINGIFLQIQLLKIKRYILNKLRFKMFLEIFKHPLNYKKLKFLPLIILPSFIINHYYKYNNFAKLYYK